MHKEDIIKNAKFYEQFLNKRPVYLKSQNKSIPEGPFYIEEIKIYWLDIQKTRYDVHYILSHKAEKRTVVGRESDIIEHAYEEEKRGIFNKIPKYNVNDIVIIEQSIACRSYGHVHNVVGVINEVFNHRDTGEVIYRIIFNSGTPRKFFEHEINDKFNTDKFKDGQSMHKQLLAKMYHTNRYDYLSEKEVIAWVYANFEVRKGMDYPNHRWDPKFMEKMYPVKSSLEALEELTKREVERIAAEPIRIEVDKMKIEEIKMMLNNEYGIPKFEYKKIIFNGPCTIILWKDGTKTIAKASGGDVFDPEKGVAICFMKKMLGHTETNKVLRKASKDYYDELAIEVNKSFDEELKKATFPLPKGVTFKPWVNLPIDNNKVIKVAKEDQDESK